MDDTAENPALKRPGITPRNSDLEESTADTAETPWRTLHQLANLPRTPVRRASSAGPPSTRHSQRRTPFARTPATIQRIGSAKRPNAVTPHGRAAQREIDIRRAGLTPGKDRRKSIRQQRKTPRDTLRALSMKLAPKSMPIVHTPEVANVGPSKSHFQQDDWEDGPEIERPRLSLPMGDEDEDDSLLLPPKSAGLEDEDFTVQSVEFGRRAHSEQPFSRFSRGSFGTVRMSDDFGDDSRMNELSEVFDLSFFANGRGDVPFLGDDEAPQGENTGVLRGLGLDRARLSLASGRGSDVRPRSIGQGDDTDTFVFNVPPREPTEDVPSSPPNVEDYSAVLGVDDDGDEIEVQDMEAEAEEEEEEEEEDQQEEQEEEDEPVDEVVVQDEPNIQYQDGDTSILDSQGVNSSALLTTAKPARKKVKISKHGVQYPSLPAGVVKKLATAFARTAGNSKSKIGKEALDVIMQASDWFFEQASEDLGAYAAHAGRKTIDESDVVTLLARQRQTNDTTTPFSLAQKYLPRELLQELRMVPPSKFKAGRQLQRVEEEGKMSNDD